MDRPNSNSPTRQLAADRAAVVHLRRASSSRSRFGTRQAQRRPPRHRAPDRQLARAAHKDPGLGRGDGRHVDLRAARRRDRLLQRRALARQPRTRRRALHRAAHRDRHRPHHRSSARRSSVSSSRRATKAERRAARPVLGMRVPYSALAMGLIGALRDVRVPARRAVAPRVRHRRHDVEPDAPADDRRRSRSARSRRGWRSAKPACVRRRALGERRARRRRLLHAARTVERPRVSSPSASRSSSSSTTRSCTHWPPASH